MKAHGFAYDRSSSRGFTEDFSEWLILRGRLLGKEPILKTLTGGQQASLHSHEKN